MIEDVPLTRELLTDFPKLRAPRLALGVEDFGQRRCALKRAPERGVESLWIRDVQLTRVFERRKRNEIYPVADRRGAHPSHHGIAAPIRLDYYEYFGDSIEQLRIARFIPSARTRQS